MVKNQTVWLWLLAFALTVLVSVYQRISGPTYPVKGKDKLAGTEVAYKFYRSWTSGNPLPVRIAVSDDIDEAWLQYRRYPLSGGDEWTTVAMEKKAGAFHGLVPSQPAAGKVLYRVETAAAGQRYRLNHGRPVLARFKGRVPAVLLLVHILFMFGGLLLALRTGLEALRRNGTWQKFIPWTLGITAIGGLILGPLVQKYAFGAYWTGFPLGGDLTDSKTLFAVLLWLAAFFLRKRSRWWTLAATVLMIAVYLIPHSLLGSELDYRTGKTGTAKTISYLP
jgi:hypothetical protein